MYPPYWGPTFWFCLHASSRTYADDEAIPAEAQERLTEFYQLLCRVLPCPGCGVHCAQHMSKRPPRFTTGQEYFRFMVDFHNRVNETAHSPRSTVTYAEAHDLLQERLTQKGTSVAELRQAFLPEFWDMLMFVTFSSMFPHEAQQFNAANKSPNKLKPMDVRQYLRFLRLACYVFPFGATVLPEDHTTVAEVVAQVVPTQVEDVQSRAQGIQLVLDMHNAVSEHFHQNPLTESEMLARFKKYFQSSALEMTRHMRQREEDHQKMTRLQDELDRYVSGENPLADSYRVVVRVLSVVAAVLFVSIVILFSVLRFGPYQIVRKTSLKLPASSVPLTTTKG